MKSTQHVGAEEEVAREGIEPPKRFGKRETSIYSVTGGTENTIDRGEVYAFLMLMASVHRIFRTNGKSSNFYYARFSGADGTEYCKSTKKTKRSEALAVAMEFERLARGETIEAHYRKVAAGLYERAAGKPLNFHTVGQWLEDWLQNTKPTVKPRTYERYKGTVADFINFLSDRRTSPLTSITPEDMVGFREVLSRRGLASSTINMCVRKTLGAPFEAAKRLGYITVNPCSAVKAVKDKVPKVKARRKPFTAEQIDSILKTSRTGNWNTLGWEGAILCGMTTALRLGDIVALRWENIDLKAGVLMTIAEKREHQHAIPLHPSFTKWLKTREFQANKDPIFPQLHGKAVGGANGLSRKFLKLMGEAGVVGEVIREGGNKDQRKSQKARAGRKISTLSFHSLRHTATSLMANAGVAADTRKAITGHRDDRVHENYTHHQMEKLKEAVQRIPVPVTKTPRLNRRSKQASKT